MSNADLDTESTGRFPAERIGDRYVVRYGLMRLVGEFTSKGPQKLVRGATVIIRSSRGVEWGEVLCPSSERTASFLDGQDGVGKILRLANDEDGRQRDDLWRGERAEFEGCREMIAEHRLLMQLVDVEHIF